MVVVGNVVVAPNDIDEVVGVPKLTNKNKR